MALKRAHTRFFWRKIKDKYRLTIYNTTTYEDVFNVNLSKLNVLVIFGTTITLTAVIVTTLIAYTPLKEFIPGYPDGKTNEQIILNQIKIDSIEYKLKIKEQYLENLKLILSGGVPKTYKTDSINKTTKKLTELNIKKSKEDSILRDQVEKEDKYSVISKELSEKNSKTENSINSLSFYPPVKGIVLEKFNSEKNHFAIDIVGKEKSPICSVLDGSVIFVGYTIETGNVIYIQHKNNILSVYKHIRNVSVQQGDYVLKGKAIASIGNTGKLSTGPHLHFELWENGIPLNPENYINFE